jgi:hypothetical protein
VKKKKMNAKGKGKKEKAESKAMKGMAMAAIMLAALLTLTVSPALAVNWYIETADSTTNVGRYSSIALDSSGYPHISHFQHYVDDLKYAYKDANGWHTLTVDSAGDVGYYTAIALDSSGYPHISYMDYGNKDLKYAYKDANGWHIETIGSAELDDTSIALDSDGYPHISYYGWPTTSHDGGLRYSYKDANGWHTLTVDSRDAVGGYSSIALDSSGYPHISYFDDNSDDLKYAYKDASGWNTQTIDNAESVGYYTSIALDSTGYPHISYCDLSGDADLKYAYKDASGWNTQTVDSGEYRGAWTSIALDGSGYPHISYMDGKNYNLMYAYKDASGWYFKTVDNARTKGTSIALDSSGYPHISYCIYTALLYAYAAENQPPIADAGPDQTAVEQDSLGGASVTLDGSGSSDPDGDPLTYSWTWPGGGPATSVSPTVSLPLGTTTIALVVNDGTVNSVPDTVDIKVQDMTPPSVVACADVNVEQATADGTEVTLSATVSDICDASPTVSWSHGPTAVFPLGSTTVTVTATDTAGNSASDEVVVNVVDITSPSVVACADVNVEQETADGTEVTLSATVSDICDASPEVTWSHGPKAVFPLGSTTVTVTATDTAGNSASDEVVVNVVDETPPSVDAGSDITFEQATAAGTEVTLSATVSDICDASPEVTWSHGPTAVFPLGSTTVTVTATDDAGNSASDEVVVNVVDETQPEISVTVSPDTLWPPNHRMVDITATVTVSDICDAAPSVVLTNITSIELNDAPTSGKGKPNNDIQGAETATEDYYFQLRAERAAKGDGRVYTITYTVTDASGNSATASATVVVPLDV